jgi:P4 family phage/plasmid primase-like protien
MKIMASTLCGTRWMEAFYILTGSGRNGKGLLFELLQAVMGDYYYQLPVQVLTTKIDNPRAPNPDIANLVGKRMVCSSEPEANEKLHEGTVKYMTGGDKLTGRALYGSPIQFKPQFGLFLQCNNIPNFNGITRGGVMRNKVIPFPFEFKSEPKTDREKRGDALIKDVMCKSTEWRDEMFHLLLDRFEMVRGKSADDIPMPNMVKERTDEYVNENNLIGVWWAEHFEPCAGSFVLSKDAYCEFRAETGSQMTDKQFKAGLEFNLLEVKHITRGTNKAKMGVAGWRRREHENVPGSDDEKE